MPIGRPPQLQLPEGWEDHIVPFDMPAGSGKQDHYKVMKAIKDIYKAQGCRGAFTHDEPTSFRRYLLRIQGPTEGITETVIQMQALDVDSLLS